MKIEKLKNLYNSENHYQIISDLTKEMQLQPNAESYHMKLDLIYYHFTELVNKYDLMLKNYDLMLENYNFNKRSN